MLQKFGLLFAEAIGALGDAKLHCATLTFRGADTPQNRTLFRNAALFGLNKLRAACIMSDMDEVLPEIDRVEATISSQNRIPTVDELGLTIRHLILRITDDLGSQHYFHVTQSDVPFYLSENAFGIDVASKFQNATEDIDEAGKCIALQRPTACVFHLMRVLEHGVQALGKRLKVKINVQTETWHQIMLHVHKACEALPSKDQRQRKRKSEIAEAAANLQSVRLAWRNEVMHPKQTYTRDEALKIFNATHAFMASLARLV